jgi:hypothetical protein
MPDPSPSEPNDRRTLSARERSALRRIEDDLAVDDPGFTHRMRGDDMRGDDMRGDDGFATVALPRRRSALVVAVLVGLVLFLVTVPPSWWPPYALLALMAASTWVLVRGERATRPPDPGP